MHLQGNERILPMRTTFISLLVAGVAVSLCTVDASAETARPKAHRHHIAAHHVAAQRYVRESNDGLPLTVNKRSFLDPGPVVPVGSENAYVTANTVYVQTPDQVNDTAQFGNSTVRQTPYVGHAAPVGEFATGPNPGDLYVGPLFGIGR
jgi:hypothetical protein